MCLLFSFAILIMDLWGGAGGGGILQNSGLVCDVITIGYYTYIQMLLCKKEFAEPDLSYFDVY